jgi:serine O-acetyltransferase
MQPNKPAPATREELYAAARAKAQARRRGFWATLKDDSRRHGRFFQRSVIGLTVYRLGVWAQWQPAWIRIPITKIYGILDKFTRPITGLVLYRTVLVGDDLHIIHAEAPISIHADCVIGDRVGIMHGVTIGATVEAEGVPIIGDDVYIGTGAVVVGPVVVGNGARIAANSLVISDIPPNSTAIGVPARAFPRLLVSKPKPKPQPAPSPAAAGGEDRPRAGLNGQTKMT